MIYYENQSYSSQISPLGKTNLSLFQDHAGAQESSLEGDVCWPVAAKEVQGSREMQSQPFPIHPVLLSPSHPLSLSACLPGFYKLSLRLPLCSPCPEHSFTHEEASTFCLCQTNYSRSPSDPASASCTRTSLWTAAPLASRHLVCPAAQSQGCPGLPCLLCVLTLGGCCSGEGMEGLSLQHRAGRLGADQTDQAHRLPGKTGAQIFSHYSSQVLIKWPLVNWSGVQLLWRWMLSSCQHSHEEP